MHSENFFMCMSLNVNRKSFQIKYVYNYQSIFNAVYGLPLLIKRIKFDLSRMYSKSSLNSYKPEANSILWTKFSTDRLPQILLTHLLQVFK